MPPKVVVGFDRVNKQQIKGRAGHSRTGACQRNCRQARCTCKKIKPVLRTGGRGAKKGKI